MSNLPGDVRGVLVTDVGMGSLCLLTVTVSVLPDAFSLSSSSDTTLASSPNGISGRENWRWLSTLSSSAGG